MEKKKTLFDYLYQNLNYQITTGYLPYGAALPSINQLSQMYHVGIRTVKDVLAALKDEGLIRSEERKPTIVIYRSAAADPLPPVQDVLEQKDSILEVYETIAVLMPCLFAFSAPACRKEILNPYFHSLERCRPDDSAGRWQICSALLHDMLDTTGNLLFCDIFTILELHARVPFFLNHQEVLSVMTRYTGSSQTQCIMNSLKGQSAEEILAQFTSMYRLVQKAMGVYLDNLSQTENIKTDTKVNCFFWNADTGRNHYYIQITRDLIDKIGIGVYKDLDFLPPESELALQYGVSVSTVRKAIATLNELGFAETFNVKGTQVTLFNDQATYLCMKNKAYKNDTLLYLSALQFMAIAVQPAVRLAFPDISKQKWEVLLEEIQKPDMIPLDLIMQCIAEHLPLQPFRLILQETNRLLHWGYYYSFFMEGNHSSNTLNQMCVQALLSLLHTEDPRTFSTQLSLCYCHVLELVRHFMADCGLPEARSLVTPDPDFCYDFTQKTYKFL